MEILFATGNGHKFREAKELLQVPGIVLGRMDFVYREIRSDDVSEIAADAALEAWRRCRKPVFVEDSGIFIRSLGGFPGTYSGWAFSKLGNSGILRLMDGKDDRSAEFRSSVAFADESGLRIFNGKCSGQIIDAAIGSKGFGYDPIFVPEGESQTFAESIELKNKLSHRYNSLLKFSNYLREEQICKKFVRSGS
jgi:XTP/dITP diphosphohydrolase